MIKRLFLLLLVLLAVSLWLASKIAQDPGYLVISYGHWLVETSLWLGLGGLLLILLVIWLIYYLLASLWRSKRGLGSWWRRVRRVRRQRASLRGFIAFAEGRWLKAQRLLVRAARRESTPLIHYLTAAQAAQRLNDSDAGEQLLSKARRADPQADMAISLTQARLQMQRQDWEKALAILTRLRQQAPKHKLVLELLVTTCKALADWSSIKGLLVDLAKVWPADTVLALEVDVYQQLAEGLLKDQQATDPQKQLMTLWDKLSLTLQTNEQLVLTYSHCFQLLGNPQQAFELYRKALSYRWSNKLIVAYGQVTADNPEKQLQLAESWLKKHPNNPELLLALGRLCRRQQLWGKAQTYLQASLTLAESPQTYLELGWLANQQGDYQQSNAYFCQGLQGGWQQSYVN
jgi:HemY protein